MSSVLRQERLNELRVALAVKTKELEKLESYLTSAERSTTTSDGGANDVNPTNGYIERALKNKAVLNQIPMQHMGNTVTLMRASQEEQEHKIKMTEKAIADLNLQLKTENDSQTALQHEIDRLRNVTGFSESPMSTVAHAKPPKVTAKEVRTCNTKLKAELRTTNVIAKKKVSLMVELDTELARRKEIEEQLGEVLNQLKIKERGLKERKIVLERLLRKHAELDDEIEEIKENNDYVTKAILDHDKAKLQERTAVLVDRRRDDDRIKKAQEFRINVLSRRLATIESALQRHALKSRVDERVASAMEGQRQRPSDAPQHFERSGGSSNPDGAALVNLNDEDPNHTAESVESENLEAYCQLERLVPDSETVPAAIHSLFVADRAKREKNIRRQEVMMREKQSTIAALVAKIQDLLQMHADAEDRRYSQSAELEADLAEHLEHARDLFDKHRESYINLKRESLEILKQINAERQHQKESERRRRENEEAREKETEETTTTKDDEALQQN